MLIFYLLPEIGHLMELWTYLLCLIFARAHTAKKGKRLYRRTFDVVPGVRKKS